MEERMQAEAAEAAREVLQGFRLDHPGWLEYRTPIDELVGWLGLDIATFQADDYPEGTYGFLEPGEDLIWLCRGLSETLRRFTLAHELGHAVLHRANGFLRQSSQGKYEESQGAPQAAHKGSLLQWTLPSNQGVSREDPCQQPDVREEVTELLYQEQAEELLGIGLSYDPRSQRELAANIFAAELLMPLDEVRRLYSTGQIPANRLASVFDVSLAAMLNRLAGLLKEPVSITGGVEAGAVLPMRPIPGRPQGSSPHNHTAPAPTKRYDEFQWAAIEASTPALIVAGPGSGKTSTLIGRAEYLMQTLGVHPQHILALTFSRKAAEEMRERLQAMLGTDISPPTVSTFHAFCAELLRNHGSLVGLRQEFTFVDEAEGFFLLRRLAAQLPLHHYQNLNAPTAHFPAILSAISRAKDELVAPAEYMRLAQQMLEQARNDEEVQKAEKALEIAAVYALYQKGLERQGDTDFGGLIMLAVQLLQEHSEVRSALQQKYQHILVDEFQDINRASGVLLRLLGGEQRRVWVVGDANQAIYSFRGASPANISNFKLDFPGAVVLPLSRNYRSRPDIVRMADTFRGERLEPGTLQAMAQTARSTAQDTYVTLAVAANEACELNGLIADIRRKQAQGYAFRDMVVLCRTRAQVRKITRALARADLPVIERGGMLEQEHIKNVLSIVLLIADPGGMGILRAARQRDHPFTQSDIEALLLAAREQQCDPVTLILRDAVPPAMSMDGCRSLTRLSTILKTLWRPQTMWLLLANYLLIETNLVCDLLISAADSQASAMLADYDGLLQLARYYDQQQQTLRSQDALVSGEDVALPAIEEQARGFLDYLSVLLTLRQDGGGRRESAEHTGEESPDVIRVMTVHASKGLEFPVVYLPYLVQRRFPMQKRTHAAPPPAGMLPPECEGETAHESGEACLFYVGATRARDHLVLSYSERYGKVNYKRSPYIDALVVGLPEERLARVFWQDDVDSFLLEKRVDQARGSEGSPWDEPLSSQPGERFIQAMKPETLSISIIENYAICPRRYAYSSIYDFRLEEGSYQLFWQATRDTLEELQRNLDARKQAENGTEQALTQQEVQELYTGHWQKRGGHLVPFASLYEQHGCEVTELLRRKLLESGDTHWQLRQSYTVEIAGKSVQFTVDRVEASAQAGKPAKFVRTRFGKRKDKPAPGTRELLYARAYRQQHPGQNIELHVHNMSTGEMFPLKLTEKKEQSLYNELEQAILGMERNEFQAKPDPFICPTCPFFLICPA